MQPGWRRSQERVKLVLETEWPEAPRDDPRLTEDEVGRVKRRTKTHVGVPGLEGDGQRPRFAPSSRPGSSESQDHVIPERKISTSGGERQKTRSMSFKVEAQRAPSRKEKQDSKTARLLKTRSKLIRSQQQYEAKANVRILADLQSEDEDDEEEEFSAARFVTHVMLPIDDCLIRFPRCRLKKTVGLVGRNTGAPAVSKF